jgi:hypothetical protein
VVSHRSAAAVDGLGHLPADVHHFTLPVRRQSRRPEVRLSRARLADDEWRDVSGLLVTRPARTAADLLADLEDPEAVAQVVADALRLGQDHPGRVAHAFAPYAVRFGLRQGDGLALLAWLLTLTGDPDRETWLDEARVSIAEDHTW